MKRASILTATAFAVAAIVPSSAAPPVSLETHILLSVQPLVVENGKSRTVASAPEAEIGPTIPGTVEVSVPWGDPGSGLQVRLVARMTSVSPEGDAVLQLDSTVTRPGRPPVTASREMRLADGGAGLFEVYGDGDRRLLLTMRAERVVRAVVRPPADVGAPVRFTIAVERVDGDRVVLLETNELHTFVGQSVEYSFRRGQDRGLESVRLSLLPYSVSGELVTIDADIDGALPGAEGSVLLSRHERIVASRLATSRLAATTGTPPAGYRFQVTPDF